MQKCKGFRVTKTAFQRNNVGIRGQDGSKGGHEFAPSQKFMECTRIFRTVLPERSN